MYIPSCQAVQDVMSVIGLQSQKLRSVAPDCRQCSGVLVPELRAAAEAARQLLESSGEVLLAKLWARC